MSGASSIRITTATTTTLTGKYNIKSIFCSSSVAGTVKITDLDNTVLVNTFSVSAGKKYDFDFTANGLKIITGGLLDITVVAE